MKNFSFFFLIVFSSVSGFTQSSFSVYGKVISSVTKQPLQGASVFAQNTTLGTATDAEGNFKLSLPDGGYNLIITFTGYNTETKRINNADANDRSVVYELAEKEKQMEEVAVVATSEVKDGWNKYGDFFIEKFIGQTTNSANCIIKNKEAVKFYFSKKRNRLKVLATEPLLIENAALGYNIKYSLDSFTHEYNSQVSLYTGYPLFEEMLAVDSDQQAKWMKARQEVYKGSMLHFMRSLYNKTLQQEGFEVQFVLDVNEKETAIPLKDYYAALNYTKDDSTLLAEVKPNQLRVGIIFNKEKPARKYSSIFPDEPSDFQFSTLTFMPSESIGIEQNGYFFEQNDLAISAYWTWDRMADQLPYNYLPVSE
ncbi:MAG: carboxypeptidase-like regulatory domain-containing protein [Gloeobacteraceae cyanobacterium ES-bin-316]|nr:carboxypeptidase-like regulatory domain-containing protein [Ferruginibacter sp.]